MSRYAMETTKTNEQRVNDDNVVNFEDKKPHMSQSSLSMLAKCGEQYRRRYIEGDRYPPGIAMLVGRATDQTVSYDLENKIKKGELLSSDIIKDFAADAIKKELKNSEFVLGNEEKEMGLKVVKGEATDNSIALSLLHHNILAPEINPIDVQKWFRIELEGFDFDLVGLIDIEEENAIRDTKTSGKTPNVGIEHKSDQLTIYAMNRYAETGKMPEKLFLDYLVNGKKTNTAGTRETWRDENDIRTMLNRIETAAEIIQKEVYMPTNPDNWWCSQKYCGYWDTCPYINSKAFYLTGGIKK